MEGRTRLEGDRVFIAGDMGAIERLLGNFRRELGELGAQVDEEEVVVGAARGDLVAAGDKGGGEGAAVFHDLLGVGLELWLEAFAETHGLRGDDVHERAALIAGENGGVEGLGVNRFREDESATWAPEGLVRGGRHEVGMRDGRRVDARSDEAGDVRDVGEEIGADGASDLAHAGKVDDAGVGTSADRDHLWFLAQGDGGELIVIDEAVVFADTVLNKLI